MRYQLSILGALVVLVTLVSPLRLLAEATSDRPESCIDTAIGDLRLFSSVPGCEPSLDACETSCAAGDSAQCLAAAYLIQRTADRGSEADALFRRGCLLGSANACTNYAASIWAGEATDEELACAHRIFSKACSANEHFACGMLGRLAFADAESPEEFGAVRSELEAACARVGGFSCRVLAKHLESGRLGEHSEGEVQALLVRACDTGDPDACGRPPSASETFN